MAKNLGFFHLGTLKTAFLMINLPIDPRNVGIFPTNTVAPFNFQKRAEEVKIFMSPSKKCPEVSRIYDSYFGWRVKYREPRKTNFVNELMEA